MVIENRTSSAVEIVWYDFDCNQVSYGPLQPGEGITQDTFQGHRWAALSGGSPVATKTAGPEWVIS
jgi:hypothetical protein